MKTPRLILALLILPLASCTSSALRESRHRSALPGNEVSRTPQTLTGRKIADPRYDVWRFQGWLLAKDAPRSFDLHLPKNRADYKAFVKEVTDAKNPAFTGETIQASIDLRRTSQMLLEDPKYRKNTRLVIGESIASKGKNVSVGLREGDQTHHWYARLELEWVRRNKLVHNLDNASYLLTVPADIGGFITGKAAEGAVDNAIDKATNPLHP